MRVVFKIKNQSLLMNLMELLDSEGKFQILWVSLKLIATSKLKVLTIRRNPTLHIHPRNRPRRAMHIT
jgi:hypothetical protein